MPDPCSVLLSLLQQTHTVKGVDISGAGLSANVVLVVRGLEIRPLQYCTCPERSGVGGTTSTYSGDVANKEV